MGHLPPAGAAKGKESVSALDLGVVWVIMSFEYEYEAQGSYFHPCVFYSHGFCWFFSLRFSHVSSTFTIWSTSERHLYY